MVKGKVSLGLTLELVIAENIAALCMRYSVDRALDRACNLLSPIGTVVARVVVLCRTGLRERELQVLAARGWILVWITIVDRMG